MTRAKICVARLCCVPPLLVLLTCFTSLAVAGYIRVTPDEPVVARAGSMYITEREFLERFELSPGLYRGKGARLENEKLKVLYSLIAEKLLAQEALERNFDQDSLYTESLTGLTKLLARDELYRQEVRQTTTVTPAEIRQGMKQARSELLVRFFFCEDSATARFLRAQIRTTKDFDRMVPDNSLGVVRDTATVIWGDADTTIERTAYALGEGEISPALRAGDGWYIVRVISSRQNPVYAELSAESLRERVTLLLRRRREIAQEIAFLQKFLPTQSAFSPPVAFRRFADSVASVLRAVYRPPSVAMDSALAQTLRSKCLHFLADTIVVAGKTAWTVDDMIDRLRRRAFRISGDSVRGVAARLRDLFEELAHQELLAQEAMRRGLDRAPEVRRKLEPWRAHFLAGTARSRIPLSASDAEVYAYLRHKGDSSRVPEVQLRELRTSSVDGMAKAIRLLENGAGFGEAVARCSDDPAARATGGLTPFFPVTERPPLGALAARLDSGQIYGPLRDSLGLLLIQVAGKRNAEATGDTSYAARFEAARRELLLLKQRRATTLLISRSAKDRGFEVYADRVRQLKVTPFPMVAYRFLGFGGRMFEVPFVEPQLDWLETEPPAGKILP